MKDDGTKPPPAAPVPWQQKRGQRPILLPPGLANDILIELSGDPRGDAAAQRLYEIGGAFSSAVFDYLRGRIDEVEFVKRLGIYQSREDLKRREAKHREWYVRKAVAYFHRQGFPKSPPDLYANTAYHKVAELMGLSVATVHAIAKRRR